MLNLQIKFDFSYSDDIYERIVPKDNFWRVLKCSSDFSEAIKSISACYSSTMGRTAINPEILLRLLIVKEYYEWSDNDTIEECRVNIALRYYVGVPLDAEMPDKATLGHFRRNRANQTDAAEKLLKSSVQAAVEAGMIKVDDRGRKIIKAVSDATHSDAYGPRWFANDILPRRCNDLIDAVIKSKLIEWDENIDVPEGMTSNEAIHFAEELLEALEVMFPHYAQIPAVAHIASRMKEEITEFKDHSYTSCVDREARVGHKSRQHSFFGYKSHILCDADSGIVIANSVTPGNGSDTTEGEKLAKDICERPDIKVEQFLGDGAYSSQTMLELAEKNKFELIATPNSTLGTCKAFDHGFIYEKDSDSLLCPAGNLSIRSSIRKDKRYNNTRVFHFDKATCNKCPLKDTCYVAQKKTTQAEIVLITDLQKELLKKQKTPEFKEKFKKRSTIERINGDIKRNQSMRKAQAPGLANMTLQSTIALYTYNMRKIHTFLKKQAK